MNNNFYEILFHLDAALLDCQKNKITTENVFHNMNYCIAAIPPKIFNNNNNDIVVHLLTLFRLGLFSFLFFFGLLSWLTHWKNN